MRRLSIFSALLLATVLVSLPALAQQDVISTFIGGGPNGIPAIDANLYHPYGVAVDTSGNFYIAAYDQNRVFKVSAGGTITVVAGSGAAGYSGDGIVGGAGDASLNHPYAVAVDGSGNVYIADYSNNVVRKVTSAATITTIAGIGGSPGFSGNGGKGTAAQLNGPSGVAVDASGNLFIADYNNCAVRKVILSTDIISAFAGNHTCGYTGDGGAATAAEVNHAAGVAVDTAGDLFITDTLNYVIRKVIKSTLKISTIAGTHVAGFSGDGGPATSAQINASYGLAANGAGTIVTFGDYNNQRVRQFTVGGNIKTVAGTGTACAGICGEGGAATSAQLDYPLGVAVNGGGKIFVANTNNAAIDSFSVGGTLTRVAGNHSFTVETLVTGIPPQGVVFNNPYGIAGDATGNVFVADSNNFMTRELVKSSGKVNFFAGTGVRGFTGDGGAATSAELNYNYGVAKDKSGNVYIADTYNCLIRMVNSAGNISTFAGLVVGTSTRCGYTGDGGPATSAELYYPYGVSVDSKGSVYIADYTYHVIRKVTNGVITTIAGIGTLGGYSGDGGPATSALLNNPVATAVDPAGNVFIADYRNCRIREINAVTGIINTVAGNGNCAYTGDGLAIGNGVAYPQGIAVDANDNLFIGDFSNRVRWVDPAGFMTTIAGSGIGGYGGDGGLATDALLNEPTGVVLDSAGNILVSDYNNDRVRKISSFSALSSFPSSLPFGLTGVGSVSPPQTIKVSAFGPVNILNISASNNYNEADNCPASLTNGATCTIYAYFAPTASGVLNGNVTVNSNGFFSQTSSVSLSGLGSSISLTGTPLVFGPHLVKTTTAALVATVANKGAAAVKMGAITLTNTTDYVISANTCPASGANLAAHASCAISVKFAPKSTGQKRGSVIVNDSDPASPQLIGLLGTGTSNVVLSTTSVTFPVTAVGVASAVTKITLTNKTGVNITLGAPAITVTGPFVNAASTTCTPNLVIANNGTCVINAQFKPTAVGYAIGSISVKDSDVTSPQSVQLQGNGTGIKFTPATVNFGTVTKGHLVSSTATITNVGTTKVFFTGGEISGTNSADFTDNYSDNPPCNNSASNPLLPGKTCQITVSFNPSKVGAENAAYKVFDNSVGSPQSLTLTGKGQ